MVPRSTSAGRSATSSASTRGSRGVSRPNRRSRLEEMEQGHPPLPAFEVYVEGLLAERRRPGCRSSTRRSASRRRFSGARLGLWHAHADQNEYQRALAVVGQAPPIAWRGRRSSWPRSRCSRCSRHQEAFDAMTALSVAPPTPPSPTTFGVCSRRRPVATGGSAISFFDQARRLDGADPDICSTSAMPTGRRGLISSSYWLATGSRRPTTRRRITCSASVLQAAGDAGDAAREKTPPRRQIAGARRVGRQQDGANGAPKDMERIEAELAGG